MAAPPYFVSPMGKAVLYRQQAESRLEHNGSRGEGEGGTRNMNINVTTHSRALAKQSSISFTPVLGESRA